ncbi:MAG: FtsW/RodA/SpoVE family cell cycle protein, partial [Firmicutes bacterium]|nr:FtsW/RodA/SpoVE family cell cycle protein [Bacillota bacterium]
MFDRRLLKNFDWQLLLIMLVICAYGLLIIGSATQEANSVDFNVFVKKQLVWIAMGLAAILLVISVDYVNLYNWCWYIYAGNLVFLIAVLFVGREAGGAYRWIDLEIFDFQPSELAKIVIIIALARLLTDYGDKLKDFFTSCIFLFYVAVPILLIALQPDLGTSLVFIIIFFAMLYMSGVPWKNLAIFLGAGLAVFPLLWTRLLPYQKMRLIVFLNPELDPLNFGYQLKQSMIAVGSGGVTGKGLFE